MRPRKFEYTLAALNATGYASNATGATWTLSATTAGDGLAHPVTIKNDTATDHSAKTAVITGTDANNLPLTETLNLPGTSATVTSTKQFKTVTSVVPSATIGTDTMDIGWTAIGTSPFFVTDCYKLSGPMVGVSLDGTTVTWTTQQTNDDLFKNAQSAEWYTLGTAGSSTSITAQAQAGCTGVRFTVASHTSGTVAFTVSQARV